MAGIVVFDIGGVLVPEGTRMDRLMDFVEEALGTIDRERFRQTYWAARNSYDLGGGDDSFWLPVLAAASGRTEEGAGDSVVPAIAAKDAELNSTIAEAPEQLLRELAESGVKLGILSNAPHPMAVAVRNRDWYRHFDSAVFSSEHGVMKPCAEIYELVDHALGISAEDRGTVFFFDDRENNVIGAETHGWAGHLWADVAAARAALVAAGYLKNPTQAG